MELTEKQEGLLERAVLAIERLSEDPQIQMETGPPICPNCEQMNPVVTVEESEATGVLGEFVIRAGCQHCKALFYAIPLQWSTVTDQREALETISELRSLRGNNSGKNS